MFKRLAYFLPSWIKFSFICDDSKSYQVTLCVTEMKQSIFFAYPRKTMHPRSQIVSF